MRRLYLNDQLQIYIYVFMYFNPVKMLVNDYFTASKYVDNYKKWLTPGPIPKDCLGLSYIGSECFQFGVKNKLDYTSKDKLKVF